jgi:hypothetical protein
MAAFGLSSDSCAQSAIAITPADSDLAHPVRSLYVGGGGNIKITTVNGQTVTIAGVNAGSIIPISVKRVWSSDTTATSILGLS